jgi:hypothetical protein
MLSAHKEAPLRNDLRHQNMNPGGGERDKNKDLCLVNSNINSSLTKELSQSHKYPYHQNQSHKFPLGTC